MENMIPQRYRVKNPSELHDFYNRIFHQTIDQSGRRIITQGLHQLGSRQLSPRSKGEEMYLHHQVGVGITIRNDIENPVAVELIGYPLHCKMAQNTLEAVSKIKLEEISEEED